MELQEYFSLRRYNSFQIDANARYFGAFSSVHQLYEIINRYLPLPKLVLGGGSNILFTKDFEGVVLRNEIRGISITGEDEESVYLEVGAGENWHELVQHSINAGYAGLENLSLIPGSTGASPIQNIGAYGVELKDVFHKLTAFHIEDQVVQQFEHGDCEFGYRDSVFKSRVKNKFIILTVTFRLSKKPKFNIAYGAIQQELEKMGVQDLSIRAVSEAVINIRRSKLPDPQKIGNAGSFFKNPQVSSEKFQELKAEFDGIIGYPAPGGDVKLAAGWLIEKAGWKGFRRGDAGVHALQALVLVNYGNAKGEEIFQLSQEIMDSVSKVFGVDLEREVNIC